MSSKINILGIVCGHFRTLTDTQGQLSWQDLFTFVSIPVGAAIFGIFSKYNLDKDTISLLVNFGAIFTALLLSVLVLVYDQEGKLSAAKGSDPLFDSKKELLSQLYFNICFSIISSLVLIGVCFASSAFGGWILPYFSISIGQILLTPLAVLIVVNLMLTIVMIVKRMRALLTL